MATPLPFVPPRTATLEPKIRMPGRHSRDAPKFRGKRLDDFLHDFEALATLAGLDDKHKCRWIAAYSKENARNFIETLDSFDKGDYTTLIKDLKENFPSAQEEKVYTLEKLTAFAKERRKIRSRANFNEYYCDYTVLSKPLVDKGILAIRARNAYFYEGIRPKSAAQRIEAFMTQNKLWIDRDAPPPIDSVRAAARAILSSDTYRRGEYLR